MAPSPLAGLHHLSAISSHAQDTIDFYAGILRLPLVKQTVNFDDPSSYHLYFGDPALQIGTLTFFVWPGAHRGQVGRGGTRHVTFSLASIAKLELWESWLNRHGVATAIDPMLDGGACLKMDDPDGLRIHITSLDGPSETLSSSVSSGTAEPAESSPPRLGPIKQVAIIVSDMDRSNTFYAEILGLTVGLPTVNAESLPSTRDSTQKDATQSTVPSVVLLQADESTPKFRLGAGLTHHFALETSTNHDILGWRDYLNEAGVPTTDIKDRRYFQSIYFRDPDGHVVEIATTGPGFAVDEALSELGQHLSLPPWLEDRRPEIVSQLPRLNPRSTIIH